MSETTMGEISDGFHTFNELYVHRSAIFLALMLTNPGISWYAPKHEDGTMFAGMFIVGMQLPTGQISYHLEEDPWWEHINNSAIAQYPLAPHWDGHSSDDVITRLTDWLDWLS